MIQIIKDSEQILAVIIYNKYTEKGIHFFTPNDFSQQLAYMNREKGYQISPHCHKVVERTVHLTQEVLFIKSGKVRVDFYDNEQNYLESRVLNEGDVILLAAGGHGFEMLESAEIVEVKQGPYCEENDKTRFEPVSPNQIKLFENE